MPESEDDVARLPTAAEWPAIAELWKRTGREIVARFGGSSMLPTIPPDVELLVRCGDRAEPGDVIAVLVHDQVVVHRVEARGHGFILTRGDAQVLPDVPIRDPAAVMGRVVGIRHGDDWRDPALAPPSVSRTLVRALCVAVLRFSPDAGATTVAALLALRRRIVFLLGMLRPPGAPR